MKRTLLTITTCIASCFVFAQSENNYNPEIPNIPYLSPEAASLGKYGEIPVSEYTGVPQIEIPIYTVKSGELELPIYLSYHASGIKVDQEATWVGLGWDLMAGGCITRIVSGAHDESNISKMTSLDTLRELLSEPEDKDRSFMEYHQYGGIINRGKYEWGFCAELAKGAYEPDIFTANFCGHSLIFYFDPFTDEIKTIGKESNNYVITCTKGYGTIRNWSIKDNKGIEYRFHQNATDIAHSNSQSPTESISSWYVTEIIHPIRGYIKLNYDRKQDMVMTYPPIAESKTNAKLIRTIGTDARYTFNGTLPTEITERKEVIDYSNGWQSKSYLSSIKTTTDTICFSLSEREDLKGGLKIDSITIRSVMENNAVKKNVIFSYSLFPHYNVTNESDYYILMNSAENRMYKYNRLKLDKVQINDQDYEFSYDSTPLPAKTSYSRDFWGYYNGKWNQSLLCTPNLRGRYELNSFTTIEDTLRIGNANRYVNPDCIKAGILTSIKYPTGGTTVFDFEPNSFYSREWYPFANDAEPQYSNEQETHVVEQAQYSDTENSSKTFTIYENTQTSIEFRTRRIGPDMDVSEAYGKLYRHINDSRQLVRTFIINNAEKNSQRTIIPDTLLQAGVYSIEAYFPDKYYEDTYDDESHAILTVKLNNIYRRYQNHGESYGGGLRIKEIDSFDEEGNLLTSKKYEYKDDEDRTSGILITPTQRLHKDFLYMQRYTLTHSSTGDYYISWWELFDTFTLSSQEKIPAITSLLATPVGYSKVTVIEGDTRKETYFHNRPPLYNDNYMWTQFQETSIFTDLLNGHKILETIYDTRNNKVKQKQEWRYNCLIDSCTTINAYAKDMTIQTYMDIASALPNGYRIWIYPFITQRIVSSHEIITRYENDQVMKDTTFISYDNPYYLPSSFRNTTSLPSVYHKTEVKYPDFYVNSSTYANMLNKNMIAFPIEISESYGGNLLQRSKNNYSIIYGKPVLASKQWAQGNNDFNTRISYIYDIHGNIVQAIRNDDLPIVYLWAYNNTLPVVKIEGITYSELTNLVPSVVLSSLGTSSTPTNIINNIKSYMPDDVMFHSYTFDPLVGILDETLPNNNKTNYEYDQYGRLYKIKDKFGNTTNRFRYNYGQ